MSDVETVVRAYGDAWLEQDAAVRDKLLDIAWNKDGVYQDPNVDVAGREALSRHIAKLHQKLPGYRIITTSQT